MLGPETAGRLGELRSTPARVGAEPHLIDTFESVGIIGGCGHVGLPLGLSFAEAGLNVMLYDVNETAVRSLQTGKMPFLERGGDALLSRHIGGRLRASSDPTCLESCDAIVCVIGTPIDEHLNPKVGQLLAAVEDIMPYLRSDQLFVLRSTVFPGCTQRVDQHLQRRYPGIDVAFCPERVAQGAAIEEIGTMPQIISGVSPRALSRARALFEIIAPETVELSPLEAELAKLFCNAWRYIGFAVANQFYTVCADNQIDYYRVWEAVTREYPRMKGLPGAGFAAGPCLFKDTMQLASFFPNDFPLGQAAMLVNEQLPRAVVSQLMRHHQLSDKRVGILGMAFKGDSDDIRESLAFKLKKLLTMECLEVLCTDEYAKLPWFLTLEEVLEKADLLVIGAPHTRYRSLVLEKPFVDPWNLLGKGGLCVG